MTAQDSAEDALLGRKGGVGGGCEFVSTFGAKNGVTVSAKKKKKNPVYKDECSVYLRIEKGG